MTHLHPPQDLICILKTHRVVAVVGFHRDAMKPAHYVPEYLHRQGYTVIPVNPALASRGESFYGQKTYARLADIPVPVDIVEVFRRSDKVHEHLDDILAMKPLPKVVWLQLGIRDDTTADALRARGIEVIQDRCMLADHRALL